VKPHFALLGLVLSISPAVAQTATDTQHTYAEDQLTVMPVVLRELTARYPDSLKRSGIGGTVRVSVVLDRKGHADSGSVRVVSTPDTALNAPARAVVLGASFAPGRVEDRAVRALIVVGVAFDPLDTATTPPPIYGEDSLTQKPALLSAPTIQYPEELRRNHIQGRVLVQMILDTLGQVERGSIQFATTPDPGFLMPVQQYLTFARFRPARRNGRLVRSIVHMPIDFRLPLPGGPPPLCPLSADYTYNCPP
jgi:TonB family protein